MYPILLKHRQRVVLLCCLLAGAFPSFAQLAADFSIDRTAGCAPLAVLFNNKTSGASAAAKYSWNFGNGNTSTLPSPGATYRTDKAYTVTLTVTDKGQTSVKTAQVTVYKAPVVSFTTSGTKGCLPLPVQFTSTAQPGDGAIAGYVWDFGNGNVVQGADKQSVNHTYTFAQKHAVSLTVTNTHGCFTTLDKPALIEVLVAPKADFTLDKKALCTEGESVQFTNTSTGTGALSYHWDFGDGTTSTLKSPSHVYAQKGAYTIKLTVTGTEGCSDTKEITSGVNVANFTHSIQAPQLVCSGGAAQFAAISSPAADSVRWNFGPGMAQQTSLIVAPVFTQSGQRTVTLTSYWGGCAKTTSTQITIEKAPALRGIVQGQPASCALPVRIQFSDTTAGAAGWLWNVAGEPVQTNRVVTFDFSTEGQHALALSVTNAAGCATTINHTVTIVKPVLQIKVVSTNSRYGTEDCIGLKLKLKAEGNAAIKDFRWDFGDGGSSTDSIPEHTFHKAGRYTVVLQYKTVGGCTDTAQYQYVSVYSKPKIDFTGPAEVCSSAPVGFTATADTTVRRFYWDYGDGNPLDTASGNGTYIEHRFVKEGIFTVKLIANNGVCADTVVKTAFIKVNPPFQAIQNVWPVCQGDRNSAVFQLYSRGAASVVWDFGDSTTQSFTPTTWQQIFRLTHRFPQPGTYSVSYTSTQGACITTDQIPVYVPGQQYPKLIASKPLVCLSDSVEITISGVKPIDMKGHPMQAAQYTLRSFVFGDGTPFTGTIQVLDGNWETGYKVVLSGFGANKSGIRVYIVSNITGCVDSSDVLPITFTGPQAGIAPAAAVCFTAPVTFRDASVGAIQKWEWNLGDTALPARSSGADVVHQYAMPGNYPVSLKVTDVNGCTNTAVIASGAMRVLGVKAGFQLPDTLVAYRTQVQFTNTSVAIAGATVQYDWLYANGSRTSTTQDLTHTYPQIGWDTVRLIAKTVEGGCADTITQSLHIDNIHAKFSYTAAYINNNACPPMLVKFQNLSRNSRSNLWNFGDGSTAQDQNTPERTYQLGGTYTVTLYTFGPGGIVDSASEVITVKGPSASISADKYFGCLDQKVTLSAKVQYAKDYYWDYGDGTVLHTRDTFSLHHYQTAGVYIPSLVMSDSTGCTVAAELPRPVVIDSLHVAIGGIPPIICDAASITFEPQIVSVAADRMGQALAYKWHFVTDSSTAANPVKAFNGEGRYPVRLQVVSPYGCMQTAYDTVQVRRTVKGTIKGSNEVCEGSNIQFTAAIPDTAATGLWLLPGGAASAQVQTPVQSFKDSGFYPIQLVVTHDGCQDTATTQLWVHANPLIVFANPAEAICLGKTAQLSASGGAAYQWSSAQIIKSGAATAQPVVAPVVTGWFSVKATSIFGCQSTDSMQVRVQQPFKMAPLADTFVCRNSSVQLQASGAHTYHWSGPGLALRNEGNAIAIATPTSSTVYTVVGTDSARCFNDTARVAVRIEELPIVKAGPDQVLLTGSEITLGARVSPDVLRYEWLPKDFLSCTTCPQPLAAPRKDIAYSIAVQNKYGCIAMDTVKIMLKCAEGKIFIPNAFTPDRNGLNETFSILGRGVSQIRSFRIYDRWGSLVFQAANTIIGDAKGAWDGTAEGRKAPSGTYVYVAELTCDTGDLFIKKGTVTLIR